MPVYMFVYMHKYLNWFCSQHKVFVGLDVDVFVCSTERARYGPTLTSGPHGLSFRAQNNLRLMFIYKHTPRRTRLTNLCSLHHQLHHSFFLSVSPSLFHSHFYLPASTRSFWGFLASSSVCLSASFDCSCFYDFSSKVISTPLLSLIKFFYITSLFRLPEASIGLTTTKRFRGLFLFCFVFVNRQNSKTTDLFKFA